VLDTFVAHDVRAPCRAIARAATSSRWIARFVVPLQNAD
jgi:hypothetical protein